MRQLSKILKYRLFIILFENFEFHNLLVSTSEFSVDMAWKLDKKYIKKTADACLSQK